MLLSRRLKPHTSFEQPSNLMASVAPQEPFGAESLLTYDELTPIIDEAIERWADSLLLDDSTLALLDEVTFEIADLDGLVLGETAGTTVLIDADAADYGWFVDLTPGDDNEFSDEDGEYRATEENILVPTENSVLLCLQGFTYNYQITTNYRKCGL